MSWLFPPGDTLTGDSRLVYDPSGRGPIAIMPGALTPRQKCLADRLISVFEDNDMRFWYSKFCFEGDGRGYTVGRGFTTTADAEEVIIEYGSPAPGLGSFLPMLKAWVAATNAGTYKEKWEPNDTCSANEANVRTLALSEFKMSMDFMKTYWQTAAKDDSKFRLAQDKLVNKKYIKSWLLGESLGLVLPLSYVVLYDTAFMHGIDEISTYNLATDDRGDTCAIIKVLAGETDPDLPFTLGVPTPAPNKGGDEKVWTINFLKRRLEVVRHYWEEDKVAVGEGAGDRVQALLNMATGTLVDRWPFPVDDSKPILELQTLRKSGPGVIIGTGCKNNSLDTPKPCDTCK